MRNGSRPQAGRRHLRAGNPRVRSRAVRYPGRKSEEGRSAGAQSGRKRPQEHGETVVFKPATFHGFRNDADSPALRLPLRPSRSPMNQPCWPYLLLRKREGKGNFPLAILHKNSGEIALQSKLTQTKHCMKNIKKPLILAGMTFLNVVPALRTQAATCGTFSCTIVGTLYTAAV